MVVKIGDEKNNLSELLDWLNDILKATFSQVEHTCSGNVILVTRLIENGEYFSLILLWCVFPGAAFCQLMDIIHPGSVDINKVKFTAKENVDILDNYNLLQDAFNKAHIKKVSN